MRPQGRRIWSARLLPVAALMSLLAALLPSQALAQSCYGGYCGSGDSSDGGSKVQVHVTVTVDPPGAGFVIINETEPASGVFTTEQGDTLVIEAIPDAGYAFDGWSDWFTESASRVEAPIYNHKTLTAHFVELVDAPGLLQPDDSDAGDNPQGLNVMDPQEAPLSHVSYELRQPRALPSSGVLIGDVYDFKPDNASFNPPLAITLPYSLGSLPTGTLEEALAIAVFDPVSEDWTALPSVVDVQNRVVQTEVAHLSEFAIIAPMIPGNAPLITPGFSFSALSVTPTNPYEGQEVVVNVVATYGGGNSKARSRVFVLLDGALANEMEIVLSPGDIVSVKLPITPPAEGTYSLDVNGLVETVTVEGPPPPSALRQAVVLADDDSFKPMDFTAPSLFSRLQPAVFIAGGLFVLLLIGPILRAMHRSMLRRRYDL